MAYHLYLLGTPLCIIESFLESIEVKLSMLEFTIAQWPLWKRSLFVMFSQAPIFLFYIMFSFTCLFSVLRYHFIEQFSDGNAIGRKKFRCIVFYRAHLWIQLSLETICFVLYEIFLDVVNYFWAHSFDIILFYKNLFGFFLLFWGNMIWLSGFVNKECFFWQVKVSITRIGSIANCLQASYEN